MQGVDTEPDDVLVVVLDDVLEVLEELDSIPEELEVVVTFGGVPVVILAGAPVVNFGALVVEPTTLLPVVDVVVVVVVGTFPEVDVLDEVVVIEPEVIDTFPDVLDDVLEEVLDEVDEVLDEVLCEALLELD